MNQDYNNMVIALANRLLEEGPPVAADNKGGASTPPAEDGAVKDKDSAAGDFAEKLFSYHHVSGSHAGLSGDTSGND